MPLYTTSSFKGGRLLWCALVLAFLCLVPTLSARADEIAVWNFNDSNLLVDHGAGSLTTTFAANATFSTPATTINARQGDGAGLALALANSANNGGNLTLNVSTAGFRNIVVSFATQRTSTGFNNNQFQYSLDGTTFVNFGGAFNPATSFSLLTFDLSSIAGLNDNPLASFRIIFNGATSTTGNNRIDNLVVEGQTTAVPEPATILLLGTGLIGYRAALRGQRAARQ